VGLHLYLTGEKTAKKELSSFDRRKKKTSKGKERKLIDLRKNTAEGMGKEPIVARRKRFWPR